MPLNVDAFRSLVGQTHFGNRDIFVSGEGKNATARLGNYFFSQGKAANNATMQAFKAALEKEYGSRRRLFLKCETFGIFCSTAHVKLFDKYDAVSKGMKMRNYRFGDIVESICHGSSLFASLFTPKEAPGIRKENLTTAQKDAIRWAHGKLATKHPEMAERLVAGNVLDGAGIKTMIDNMPEDEDERAWITDVLDYMLAPLEKTAVSKQGGDYGNRIGNEIMIDAKDLA